MMPCRVCSIAHMLILPAASSNYEGVAHRDGAAVPYATFDGNAQPLGLKEVQGGQVTKTYQARNGK